MVDRDPFFRVIVKLVLLTVLPCPFAFPRFLLLRAVTDLGTKTSAMEDQYDKLIAVKTKGELQGFGKPLI